MNRTDDEILSAENLASDTFARRGLRALAYRGLRVKIVCARDDSDRLTSVLDITGYTPIQLDLDQPLGDTDNETLYGVGDDLTLFWSDYGMRYGARATVVRVKPYECAPVYMVNLADQIHCIPERRIATSMPVNDHDGVKASLFINGETLGLSPSVADINSIGVRLLVPLAQINSRAVEPKMTSTLSLSFSSGHGKVESSITVIWMHRHSPESVRLGCVWSQPSNAFIQYIEAFIRQKEDQLT